MHLEKLYRYPVKGFTPERVNRTTLEAGSGIPFDRCCAFVCGNLPDPPVRGGWVPARTFFQLTVFPELAAYKVKLDEDGPVITVTAPDGAMARAALGQPASFAGINRLIRERLPAGPHATPELFVQAPKRGQWDFTDTCISLINLASVRDLEKATGKTIDPVRFRGNLFIDGLEPWQEFSLIGHRIQIGDAKIDLLRPAMRCAATSVDPETADTLLNVPVSLRKHTGHLFCGLYGRVVDGGAIAEGDEITDLGSWDGNPYDDLPERTPDPVQWPRNLQVVQVDGEIARLTTPNANWPLLAAKAGQILKLLIPGQRVTNLSITQAGETFYDVSGGGLMPGSRALVTGPFDKG